MACYGYCALHSGQLVSQSRVPLSPIPSDACVAPVPSCPAANEWHGLDDTYMDADMDDMHGNEQDPEKRAPSCQVREALP